VSRKLTSTRKRIASEAHWVPLSDLMTGLMMVFMLIAVAFMLQVRESAQKTEELKRRAEMQAATMREIAFKYTDIRERIFKALEKEFVNDLPNWGAALDPDLTVRFKEPDVLFASGKYELSPRFKEILSSFFPRYLNILTNPTFRDSIEEVRIEGHTSSNWIIATSSENAYMLNMELSQARTRSVLQYVLFMQRSSDIQTWLIGHLTANGLSSSKPRKREGVEIPEESRRVEFRVRTNADSRLAEVIKAAQTKVSR
jgi:outer membrane protein OmpA-like peptidoglycan-associated protein